jgi:hypothetical protein
MLHSLLGFFGLGALFGFIGYAFYHGTKVHPDRNNIDYGPSLNSSQTDRALKAGLPSRSRKKRPRSKPTLGARPFSFD